MHLRLQHCVGKKNMTSPPCLTLVLCGSGWRKAEVSHPRRDAAGQLGVQYLRPEELLPRRSLAIRVGAHRCRGHGPPQYRGTPAGAPHWPAWPLSSSRWGLLYKTGYIQMNDLFDIYQETRISGSSAVTLVVIYILFYLSELARGDNRHGWINKRVWHLWEPKYHQP